MILVFRESSTEGPAQVVTLDRVDVHDPSQSAISHQVAAALPCGVKQLVVADADEAAGSLRRVDHKVSLGRVDRERLFDVHVHAGSQGL